VQLLTRSLPADDGEAKLLEIIHRESQRLDRTIKGFLRFARPRERSATSFDVAALLAENDRAAAQLRRGGRLSRPPPRSRPAQRRAGGRDRDQISQIFWNLARNALRAMPGGGELVVRGRLEGDRYRIEFQDNGHGMTDDQRGRLFQPFQSYFDGGTGIGMAIVYRIVQEHGGRIEVETAPAHGTRVSVLLPRHLQASSAAQA
jgi:two-component system, NtrC family, sensor histidine kinase PilS